MSNAMAVHNGNSQVIPAVDPATILNVAVGGDLSQLSPQQQLDYYRAVCQSLGLNPLTRPFGYIRTDGKVRLYALKDCTEQLRASRRVSITKLVTEQTEDLITVTAYGSLPDGRTDSDVGVVYIRGLKGDALSNALMKATTKAKRRLTLSLCGLGMLDESEVASVGGAEVVAPPTPANELDSWRCARATAERLVTICDELAAQGVTTEQMRSEFPHGIQSRKDLSEEQALATIEKFAEWVSSNAEQRVHEGQVVNG